jgi:hypothetical protein
MVLRVQSLALALSRPWPGGPALKAKLQRADAPAAAWSRLAHVLHAEWLKGREHPGDEAQDTFIDAVAIAWQGKSPAERLASGLFPALIRALAARHRRDDLAALVPDLAACADDPDAAPALGAFMRQLRQLELVPASTELLRLLRPAWQPGRAWAGQLLTSALALAREADSFGGLRVAADWLDPLLTDAEANGGDAPTWRELGKLAQRCLDVTAMQRVVRSMLAADSLSAETQPVMIQLLTLLAQYAPDTRTRALLEQAASIAPRHPAIALGRARIAHAQGAGLGETAALMDPMDPQGPGYASALSWWAGALFHGGDEARALALYGQLASLDALTPADRLRMGHLTVRDVPAATAPPPPEAPAETDLFGLLSEALAPLAALWAEMPTHGAALNAATLVERGRAAAVGFRDSLSRIPAATMQTCTQIARQLSQLDASAFASHTQWLQAFPFPLGPAYGRVDAERCRALGLAVQAHVAVLCGHALDRPDALRGAPAQASLRQALDLAELRWEARFALGEGRAGLSELHALQGRLGLMGREPLRALEARARLALGELRAVRGWAAAEAVATEAPHEVLPMRRWHAWLAAEDLTALGLVIDTPVEGQFETVGPDGELHRHAHRLAPTALSLVHCASLQVRHSHLVLGPRGGILLPEPWHRSMGDYPYEHPRVRLRGAQGAVLRSSPGPQRIDAPVLVLGNLDATYHRNYYHWMLLILARIERLRLRGLLDGGRQLLLPRELSGWMRSSLAGIGVSAAQCLEYGQDEELHLSDALLVSPLEFASPALVEGLRRTLWQHAGLDPDAPPAAHRLLYISRRGEGRRPLVEEARIQGIAETLGFEVVAPETLSLLDQVRLFAEARGVAGPPGAAHTNLAWAGAGTRVLSIFKEEVHLPTFVDISIIRGQQHRWLLGRNLPGYDLMSVVNAPFSVDPALAERELRWVAGA